MVRIGRFGVGFIVLLSLSIHSASARESPPSKESDEIAAYIAEIVRYPLITVEEETAEFQKLWVEKLQLINLLKRSQLYFRTLQNIEADIDAGKMNFSEFTHNTDERRQKRKDYIRKAKNTVRLFSSQKRKLDEKSLRKAFKKDRFANKILSILSERITAKLKASKKFPVLKEIEDQNAKIAQIKRKIVRSHLRFVVSKAKQYHNRSGRLSFLDIIQEGNTGLSVAVDHFDWERGSKFLGCAKWWIKKFILRAIENSGYTIRKSRKQPSLGQNKDSESSDPFAHFIDPSQGRENEARSLDEIQLRIRSAIEQLADPRERAVLKYRYGIDGQPILTWNQIHKKLGYCNERLRLLEVSGKKKLKELLVNDSN